MLQMLLNCPLFLNQLKSYCSHDQNMLAKLPDKDYELVLKTSDVSMVEKELLSIWESDKDSISPANLRSALLQHKEFKMHFSGFNEQDSHEVFIMILNIIKEAQIKRIRGAVLDYFNSRKNLQIDDETKKKIKDISAIVEKQTLVNNLFGIVIGSNLKCQMCGELRMRFDEVFHLTPVFVVQHDHDHHTDKAVTDNNKDESEAVILKPKNQSMLNNEKMSKHQMKRQKRVEKKIARNKKSIKRNIECSPEDTYTECNGVIVNGNESEEVTSLNPADIIDEELEEDDCYDNEIVIGGNVDDIVDRDVAMQQLIYDTVTLESMAEKVASSNCSSSNGSMIARQNDSSRESIKSLDSSIDDVLCYQVIQDLTIKDDDADIEVPGTENEDNNNTNSLDNNSCLEVMEYDSDADNMSSAGSVIRANVTNIPQSDVSCIKEDVKIPHEEVKVSEEAIHFTKGNDEEEVKVSKDEVKVSKEEINVTKEDVDGTDDEEEKNVIKEDLDRADDEEEINVTKEEVNGANEEESNYNHNIVIIDSRNGDRNKAFYQSAYSSALETHQDRLHTHYCQDKIAFESETDLDRALRRYTMPLFLENICCETCSSQKQKVQTNHFKTDVLCHLPQILPFYISRFKQCTSRNRTKNTQVYSYPFILNLSSQCSKYANFTSDSTPVLYRLFGIIEHIGARINTGHYVSYVCRPSNRCESKPSDSDASYCNNYPNNITADISHKHEQELYNRYQSIDHQSTLPHTNIANHSDSDYKWFRVSDNNVESVTKDTVMRVQVFMLFYSRIQ